MVGEEQDQPSSIYICCSILENLECSRTHHINLVYLRIDQLYLSNCILLNCYSLP